MLHPRTSVEVMIAVIGLAAGVRRIRKENPFGSFGGSVVQLGMAGTFGLVWV